MSLVLILVILSKNRMKNFATADSALKVYDLIIKNAPSNTLIFLDIDDIL